MRCVLCEDTGWLKAGMVVTPVIGDVDDYVAWVSKLVACSHPETPGTVPGEPTQHRTAQASPVGAGLVGGEVAGHSNAPEGGPAASPVAGGGA